MDYFGIQQFLRASVYVCLCVWVCVFLSHVSSTASLYNYLPTWPIDLPSTPFLPFPSLPFHFFLPFLLFLPSLSLSFFPPMPLLLFPFIPPLPFIYSLLFLPSFPSFISFHSFVHNVLCFLLDRLLGLVWACMCVGERVRARG